METASGLESGGAVQPGLESQNARDTMAASILKWADADDLKIAAAESLTAGLLADAFVRIPGASSVFLGSAVTYDIHAKASVLGVDAGLLEREGAVHPEVARQMARGAAHLYNQPAYQGRVIGLSTTGVAGPGPDGDKPAGLVYIGVALPSDVFGDCGLSGWAREHGAQSYGQCGWAFELRFQGQRESVRRLSVQAVLQTVMSLTHVIGE